MHYVVAVSVFGHGRETCYSHGHLPTAVRVPHVFVPSRRDINSDHNQPMIAEVLVYCLELDWTMTLYRHICITKYKSENLYPNSKRCMRDDAGISAHGFSP